MPCSAAASTASSATCRPHGASLASCTAGGASCPSPTTARSCSASRCPPTLTSSAANGRRRRARRRRRRRRRPRCRRRRRRRHRRRSRRRRRMTPTPPPPPTRRPPPEPPPPRDGRRRPRRRIDERDVAVAAAAGDAAARAAEPPPEWWVRPADEGPPCANAVHIVLVALDGQILTNTYGPRVATAAGVDDGGDASERRAAAERGERTADAPPAAPPLPPLLPGQTLADLEKEEGCYFGTCREFVFYRDPIVSLMFPRGGPTTGGFTVTAVGSRFDGMRLNQSIARCAFGNYSVPVTVLPDSGRLTCRTPPTDGTCPSRWRSTAATSRTPSTRIASTRSGSRKCGSPARPSPAGRVSRWSAKASTRTTMTRRRSRAASPPPPPRRRLRRGCCGRRRSRAASAPPSRSPRRLAIRRL